MSLKDVALEIATELYPSWQAGLNDMHHALKAFPDSLSPAEVLGQVGTPTPGEVDRSMNASDLYGPDWREQYSPDAWAGYEQHLADQPEISGADVDRMFEQEVSRQDTYEQYLDLTFQNTPEPEREPEMELER